MTRLGQFVEAVGRDFTFRSRYRDLVAKNKAGVIEPVERQELWVLHNVCLNDARLELDLIRFMTGTDMPDDELTVLWNEFKQDVASK
jgi:hypothetical protein